MDVSECTDTSNLLRSQMKRMLVVAVSVTVVLGSAARALVCPEGWVRKRVVFTNRTVCLPADWFEDDGPSPTRPSPGERRSNVTAAATNELNTTRSDEAAVLRDRAEDKR